MSAAEVLASTISEPLTWDEIRALVEKLLAELEVGVG